MFNALPSAQYNTNNDKEVGQPPDDSIQCLKWSPAANYMVVGSWDGKVRCYEISTQGDSQPKVEVSHSQPVLCCDWMPDGSAVFTGGCDNLVKLWNLTTQQQQQVAAHDAPIRHCFYSTKLSMLITGSWDKTVKYWDMRSPTPAATVQLPERVYAMDVKDGLMVLGLAERHIQVFNLESPGQPFQTSESPLKWQTRCVACFPDQQGYLLGSIEGRVAVHHVAPARARDNFTFKCHRTQEKTGGPAGIQEIYAVNAINVNQQHGTFVTAGSDGSINFWDKDSKQRLKAMASCNIPITCGGFNKDGTIYAYALSYDWSKGHAANNEAEKKTHILLHAVQESDIKPRSKAGKR